MGEPDHPAAVEPVSVLARSDLEQYRYMDADHSNYVHVLNRIHNYKFYLDEITKSLVLIPFSNEYMSQIYRF